MERSEERAVRFADERHTYIPESSRRAMSRALCMIRRCLMFVRIVSRFAVNPRRNPRSGILSGDALAAKMLIQALPQLLRRRLSRKSVINSFSSRGGKSSPTRWTGILIANADRSPRKARSVSSITLFKCRKIFLEKFLACTLLTANVS